jgi:hypothetical protein
MKAIAEQAAQLVTEAQMIADNLAEYNPGLCKDKIPLDVIQYDLACLGRDLTWLYAEIGKKIKNETV